METFSSNIDMLIYFISLFLILAAAYIIACLPSISQNYYSINYKYYVQKLKEKAYASFCDTNMDILFKEAGYPFNLTSLRFNLLRFSLLLLLTVYFIKSILIKNSFSPFKLLIIILIYIITSPNDYSLVIYTLKKMKRLHNLKKNKECFLLYSMLLNEFNINDNRSYNLYSILQRYSIYFHKIKPAILKTLALWKSNPDKALDSFAIEIGTNEAKDLAQILKTVDLTNSDSAKDLIKSRYDQFQTSRHEYHRRAMKNKDLLGYIIFFIPTLAILFNMVFVLGLAVQNLLQKLNSH